MLSCLHFFPRFAFAILQLLTLVQAAGLAGAQAHHPTNGTSAFDHGVGKEGVTQERKPYDYGKIQAQRFLIALTNLVHRR
jgi:hypothetical protein